VTSAIGVRNGALAAGAAANQLGVDPVDLLNSAACAFMHDALERSAGRSTLLMRSRSRGLALLARKTDRIDARVLPTFRE